MANLKIAVVKPNQPWLKSSAFDLIFILLPPIFAVTFSFLFAERLGETSDIPQWAWLIFVLGIDVSHVYSTLFRTYFNAHELKENRALLTLIPVGVWLIGILLYSIEKMLFWRVITYVAVFHFIRQQYGFLRLYMRAEVGKKDRWLANITIYLASIYPLIYWHSHQPRNFHWFIDGDFFTGLPTVFSFLVGLIYLIVLFLYCLNELLSFRKTKNFNLPKNAIIFGTALSWYVGIIYFNGDMTFTITNIVAHGVPYIALVWLYGDKQKDKSDAPLIFGRFSYRMVFSPAALPLFFLVLLVFGYLEEGLWAGLVWREHLEAFGIFSALPQITAKDTLSWLVPLLTLPQVTHYVLDGFIWKVKDSEANWQKILFTKKAGA